MNPLGRAENQDHGVPHPTKGTEAFDVFGCPLSGTRLIEASAGTGKTWNLCGLYLRLLLERQLPVQDILVVTFTNAATAELRERIRSRIAQTLAQLRGTGPDASDSFVPDLLHSLRQRHASSDDDMALRLDLALQTFDEASIFTIHGFCQRALAETPFSAGMPMALTLLRDDSDMRLDVVHDFWRRHVAGEALSPGLAGHLLDMKDSPVSLAALLERRLAKPLAQMLWPAALDQPTLPPDALALHAAFDAARALWLGQRETIVGIVREARPRLNGNTYKLESLQQAIDAWDELLAQRDAPSSLAGLNKLDLLSAARLKPNKGKAPPAPHAFFACAEALLGLHAARDEALTLQRLQLLRELLLEGPRQLRQAKREMRVTAFDDMLYNLHQRLGGEGGESLAQALRTRFAAALIDEFQDTDPLQFAIFHAVYAGSAAPLFLVGDPKQAIYSFRNADLHTYLRARGEAQAEYTLAQNQRSTPELLSALNALFGANARAFMLPGLDYRAVGYGAKPRKALLDRSQPRAALQLWRLPRGRDGEPLHKKAALQAALDACAAEIARLLGAARRGEITLGDRPLAAGDIAVLVRSHAHGSAMRRALAHVGVGSVELSQASVFDSADAAELERLLAAILEPTRAPLLRAALATELMGLDAAALQAMSADEAALLDCITRFAGYRETWLQRGVGLMLRRWMRAEGVSRRLLARPDGERRMTNLRHLAECLHEAAEQHAAPEALLRWLQAQRSESRIDDAVQLRLESDRDLVQVVTMHKSKGLEYPLVFCPTLWDGHAGGSRAAGVREYHDEDGDALLDFRSLDKEQAAPIAEQMALESAAEGMRLIYVALTRAVHRCYLVVGPYRRKHGKHLSVSESCRARLNWLVAGAGLSPQAWLKNSLGASDIDAAWAALAQQQAPHVVQGALPMGPGLPLPPLRPPAEALAALPAPAHIAPGWWIGSYSSLAHGARHDDAALDHDLRVDTPPDAAQATVPPAPQAAENAAAGPGAPAGAAWIDADDILHFPRGAVAGECLHAVFERIDFTDPTGWPAAVGAALQRFAQALPSQDTPPRWADMLARMLHDVLNTPLPGGFRLADVPAARKQVEMEFHLPAEQLDDLALTHLLRRQGYDGPHFGFGMLRGYLRGFIDLVFEHGGRYFVLDWKSNHLGDTPADYGRAALARAMGEQGYHLQALLYALAL
ncbi:MAG TPA: exodeoxyribonuclease V subunit beta, partial [Rubrivivax sp.]|nr:exodeoxyribonuclease V subunit beta [Rubrivivax sp.]